MAHKKINLALQGGGAHGAFTWGVLDRLLECDELEIAGISGTSAGAVNGAAYKAGMRENGRPGARENLAWLWDRMGAMSEFPMTEWFLGELAGPATVARMLEHSPGYQAFDLTSRMFSPYGFGPGYQNPLAGLVREFHYSAICADDGPKLFVSATNVRSGKVRVFSGDDITPDAILASACLPTAFQAVEILDQKTGRREAYWDGGYTGNPALFPLYAPQLPEDVVIVGINPLYRDALPITASEIQNRINEISFNAALLGELRAIDFVKRLLREGQIKQGTMKDVKTHMIADNELMTELSVATKLVPTPYILQKLREAGRNAADDFLARHWDDLGQRGTMDLAHTYK